MAKIDKKGVYCGGCKNFCTPIGGDGWFCEVGVQEEGQIRGYSYCHAEKVCPEPEWYEEAPQ